MTARQFRAFALTLPEAEEHEHMGHPDFRVGGKIFATLGYPDKNWGVVKLTLDQQWHFVQVEPEIFIPVKGAWGRRGATNVHLPSATKAVLIPTLTAAWRNVAPRHLVKAVDSKE